MFGHVDKFNLTLLSELETGIVILDASLKISSINSSALSFLDTSEKVAIGKQIDQIFYEEPDSLENFKESLKENRRFNKIDAMLHLKGEKKVLCNYSIHPIEDESKQGLLIEIVNKETSSELIERYRMKKNQQISQDFIRGMAHEIKNPLSGIRGSAQLLSNKLKSIELKEYTDVIIKQTDRLTALVDSVLGPNKKPDFKWQNIHYPIENVIKLIRKEPSYKGIKILNDFDPSIPELCIDSYLIENSILNLVKNARDALIESNTSSPHIQIVTRVSHSEIFEKDKKITVCKISVIDNGPGIAKEIKDSIFFPMITGKEKGTGLGLSITQGIISQHKGTIRYESSENKTEFFINIPVTLPKNDQIKIVNG
jgi:two-component system nitrogen regulation sensor histidine kinase GlnL|tara:strand:+ start:377 stop:1483 length:1107 start_codon:yes stop_codon:yes gene_type:complete